MRIVYLTIIISLFSFSCKREIKWDYELFFEQTFKLIEANSVKKNDINWSDIKSTVKDSIKRFNSNEDVYNAIGYTIKLIDDGHSIFVAPQDPDKGKVANALLVDTLSIPDINIKIVGDDIGYINLPGFVANDSLTDKYALAIRKALINLDTTSNLSGWIIDLRNHSGGKLSSEPLGLSPLFEQSLIGIAWDNTKAFINLRCTNNYFYFGDIKIDSLHYNLNLINKNKKIAVLVSDKTVSGGEFLALAFKYQEHTKLFGSKTKGKTSHLKLIEFKSNAKLLLATAYYCDKDSTLYKTGIIPDIVCDVDQSLNKAIEWIKTPNKGLASGGLTFKCESSCGLSHPQTPSLNVGGKLNR